MCRNIAFTGSCTRCAGVFTWWELSQELRCLEAKNAGAFGQCRRGVQTEEHSFDQECESCAVDCDQDEGYGGMDGDMILPFVPAKPVAVGRGRKARADRLDEVDEDRRHKKQRR